MKKFRLLTFLKSDNFALTVAILSVILQSFHSYYVFNASSSLKDSGFGIAQALLFAAVVDMAILFYTLRNRRDIALGAALAMFVINGYYYYLHYGTIIDLGFWFGCFLSLVLPASVYFYSEEIKDISDVEYETEDEIQYQERIRELDAMNEHLKENIKRLEGTISGGMEENKRLIGRLDEEIAIKMSLSKNVNQFMADNALLKKVIEKYETALSENKMPPEDKSLLGIHKDDHSNDAGSYITHTAKIVDTNRPVIK